ncbi:iron-containing redox enzyme family protein [Micromonospora sp. WMMD1120]|uniref:iron-containing redox enzyme family protein n=1 Tax=Micromonospora sp. WMMD1120 TaxID=3016106 RepID=UPI00241806C0|nr:iron-containing redox enzyme family protein [Micromonospora sp. WMMD1120]MDG4807551.1 iron-containing redox enzyme family protein [Micromonospora sp. WMMD1120]
MTIIDVRTVRPDRVDRAYLEWLTDQPADVWEEINTDFGLRQDILRHCQTLVRQAYTEHDPDALRQLHDALLVIYDRDFSVPEPDRTDADHQPLLRDIAGTFERAMLADELRQVPEEQITGYPVNGNQYLTWLKRLIAQHPARNHELYETYLSDEASVEDFRFYLAQETSLDPRFDDILALMQVGTAGPEKMEIASNYWDEMGGGRPEDVHTLLFARSLDVVGVDDAYVRDNLLLDARISSNLSSCLALGRRHYYRAVGYFGVTEYLVPQRFKPFIAGWRRLGLPERGLAYHELHVRIDAVHAAGWFHNVVAPLVSANPRAGREIAAGALIRLNSSARYLDALLAEIRKRQSR